jgi:hypothetical protein
MAGIEINNGVANAGSLPAVFAGSTAPTLPSYSLWLDTSTNILSYFDGSSWVAVGAVAPTPNLDEVLIAGNTTTQNAIFGSGGVYAGAFPLSSNTEQSLMTKSYNGQQMTDNVGKTRGFYFYANSSFSNRPVLLFLKDPYAFVLVPPDITSDQSQSLVEASGDIYPGLMGTTTLVSGVVSIVDPNITANSTVTFAIKTAAGTLGVGYKGVITPGVGVAVTSLKTNTTTETSDNSVLYYQIWHTN